MRIFPVVTLLLLLAATQGVCAQAGLIPAPPKLSATAYILLDANTGHVIMEHSADQKLAPASLTKIMTSYIVANEIDAGNLSKDDLVTVSEKAWRMEGSRMFIEVNEQVRVEDLMRGVIIQSGNDASVALAEHIAGSEDAFADIMNQQAALLGMEKTVYKNATGWPHPEHITTARDLSKLARALIQDHPEHYSMYAEKYYTWGTIKQPNRNRLLWRDNSVDGIKTGHTNEAGFCLVASALKNNMRLVSVVMGTRSDEARATESQKMLSYGFRYYETATVLNTGQEVQQQRVWGGLDDQVWLGVEKELLLTLPKGSADKVTVKASVDNILHAPLKKHQQVGNIIVSLGEQQLAKLPLVTLHDVEKAGLVKRITDNLRLKMQTLLGK